MTEWYPWDWPLDKIDKGGEKKMTREEIEMEIGEIIIRLKELNERLERLEKEARK